MDSSGFNALERFCLDCKDTLCYATISDLTNLGLELTHRFPNLARIGSIFSSFTRPDAVNLVILALFVTHPRRSVARFKDRISSFNLKRCLQHIDSPLQLKKEIWYQKNTDFLAAISGVDK